MSIFKRLFNIGSAEVNKAVDKLEDPIKMTEQGIRDLKVDLNKSLQGLAQVKAIAIRTRNDIQQSKAQAAQYENKAVLLLKKAQSGALDGAEADRLASTALTKKEQQLQHIGSQEKILATQEEQVAKMEQNIQRLKSQISKWESELKTLKARHKVSQASSKLNKQLANIDASSTVSMLERMKEKVDEQEALAESYSDIADANITVDEEINKALGPGAEGSQSASLLELKAKLGLAEKTESGMEEEKKNPPTE
ncbi:MAG: PspA/IM30 family protein [Flammeovirgaceae bacterium]